MDTTPHTKHRPDSFTPAESRRLREAEKARRRLYPVSICYSIYSMAILLLALRSGHPVAALAYFAAGIVTWTFMEYLVHRYILHGHFPDGDNVIQHFLHKRFDPLHWEHHERPWDGEHISGRVGDTIPFVAVLAALSFLAPFHTLPVLWAGVLQSYVVEEWVHHSVHFYRFRNPYFRYIRRHHLYHHSPKGAEMGYGLTSGIWDVVCNTRIPADTRRALYR